VGPSDRKGSDPAEKTCILATLRRRATHSESFSLFHPTFEHFFVLTVVYHCSNSMCCDHLGATDYPLFLL
jgi:hypothetical protein